MDATNTQGPSEEERDAPPGDFAIAREPSTQPPVARPKEGNLVSQIVWLIMALVPLATLVTATTLTPDPNGVGTHTQLGLPPCGFLASTGWPCPGCGLTTSFSHMVRFQWAGAAAANAFGIALFLVSAFSIPISAMGFIKKWPVVATLERFQFEKVVVMLAFSSTIVWTVRILTILF